MKRPFPGASFVSVLLAAFVALTAAHAQRPAPSAEQVGPLPDGRFRLSTGFVLEPAGRQIPLSTFPMASAISPDGRQLVVLQGGYKKPSLTVFSLPALTIVGSHELDDGWLGLVFDPRDTGRLYVSGGSRASVYEFHLAGTGELSLQRTFTLVPQERRKHSDFLGDLAVSPDGRRLYAAGLHRDSVWVIDTQAGTVVGEWKTAHRPYRLLFHPDGKSLFVTGWGDGSLHRHDASSGRVVARTPVGPSPMDMVWRTTPPPAESRGSKKTEPVKHRLFVALANTNTVAVLGETDRGGLRPIEQINVALSPVSPPGMTPSALALTPDGRRLYVVCSDANTVAVVDVSTPKTQVAGFIPTGWYPTAAQALADGSLLVFNGRGGRSYPNPQGPNPGRVGSPLHQGIPTNQYVGALQNGTASHIADFDAAQLSRWSDTVRRNSPFNPQKLESAGAPRGSVVPDRPGRASPIRHVIYIVKENRTYDQVLGDLEIGNGDPSLTLFGEDVTPNHHQLAREFVLLDNFYVNADVSADGHNWSSAAIAPAYVQRMWPNSYGGRRKHYDYEGGEKAALPPSGYIWNNVLAARLTLRNYGYWCSNISPAPAEGQPQIADVRDAALRPHTSMRFRAYDLEYRDVDRAKAFIAELREFEQKGDYPRFTVVRIGNDHTSGTARGRLSPKAQVADNDLALGMIVEAMSKSRFWPRTAIFVLEDDAQNGPDHVDSHRSPAFVLSPYTRGRGLDSSMYNTVSMLRTMELILGVKPMTMHDAGARPMFAAFRNEPDVRPYTALPARHPLDERNGVSGTSVRSERMNWSEADMIDDDELNQILWLAIKGTPAPSPTRSFFSRE